MTSFFKYAFSVSSKLYSNRHRRRYRKISSRPCTQMKNRGGAWISCAIGTPKAGGEHHHVTAPSVDESDIGSIDFAMLKKLIPRPSRRSPQNNCLTEKGESSHCLDGIVSESSLVSASGCLPAGRPFCWSRYASRSSDSWVVNVVPAYCAIGPLISPHTVNSFTPPYNCCHDTPFSDGPAPPSKFAPWQRTHD
jgi:hypothetical protein